jgi:hypothetical protein
MNIRDRAKLEAIEKLRKSWKQKEYTEEQMRMFEEDRPFEIGQKDENQIRNR